MPSYIVYLVIALVSIFVTTNWFLPLLAQYLTRCRLTYLSLSRIKGFEWRHESHASAIVPDIRLEHGSWRYGGWNRPEGVGFIVIHASGLSYRQRDRPRAQPTPKPTPSRSPFMQSVSRAAAPLINFTKTLAIGIPSLLIHHYPSLGGLVSFHIADGRIIFDELDGLELTWSTLKLGARVSFSKKEEAGLPKDGGKEGNGRNSISSTTEDVDPAWPASPPESPVISTRPFAFPPASELKDEDILPRPSRLSHARRQASAMSSRMTSTAAQVWGRFIGRAKGNVKLTVEFSNLAIILPHSNPAHPLSKPSIPDLVPQPHPQCDSNGLSHHPSSRSLKARKVQTTYSMDRLFRSVPRYALPSHEGGYERLLALEEESKITGTMRFGTRRGWLAEDTLSLDTELGKLHTSLGAWTKVQDLMGKYKEKKSDRQTLAETTKHKEKANRWSSDSKQRVMLRAFHSVSISLSQVVISHFLSVSNSNAGSTNSSSSDLSSLASDDYFTVSLDVRALSLKLTAADSSNNLRARNAFGTNSNRTSRVKGVGLGLTWDAVEIDCISPGEGHKDRNQLLSIRNADFEGLTTWRPHGWTRDELLFATDPNLALVVLRATVGFVDAAADVQLLNELLEAWKATHPARSKPTQSTDEKAKSPSPFAQGLPPRVRLVFDIGNCMFVLADRISQQKTTLTISTDGMHFGCFTTYSDRVGRRKDKTSMRTAFKEEDLLQQRRAEMGDDVDYALPDAMLKPQVRRRFHHEHARLLEDLTMSMSFDGNFELEPVALHLSVQHGESGHQETFSLAEIGRTHGIASGDVLGRQLLDLVDTARLDPTTISGSVGFGIDSGINVNLWEKPVIDALVALGKAHTRTDPAPPTSPKDKSDILSRIPSGLSCRFSLGLVSVFVGQPDPNPASDGKLVRGIWFQTFAVMEYAYFVNSAQTLRSRHHLIAPVRAKLKLPEDVTTQALACYHHHAPTGGRAALCRLTLLETFITPIFNGKKFDEYGGTKMNFETWKWPKPPMQEHDYTSWDFVKPQGARRLETGVFANAIPNFDEPDTHRARRPLFRISGANIKWTIQRKSPDAELEHRFTGRSEPIAFVCELSLIYCATLAAVGIKRVSDAWKRPSKDVDSAKSKPLVYFDYSIPSTTIHIAFPLKEQVFVYLGPTHISHEENREIKLNMDQLLVFVPSTSPREKGQWQELGVIKKLSVKKQSVDSASPINVDMEAFRIRVPVGYHISKLVLNLTVSVKALKLIIDDLKGGRFSTVKSPVAEAPKKVPHVVISIKEVSLEAKDSPIEERLNLIWRVGLAEQLKRNELERLFEEKTHIIERMKDLEDGEEMPSDLQHTELGSQHTRSPEEALYNLRLFNSQNWIARIKAAQEEQRRREQLSSNRLHSSTRDLKLPISIAPPALSAPLFRASFSDFKLSVKKPDMTRNEIIQYMSDVSTPFEKDTEFSLMVPLQIGWEMGSARVSLRDYPLPLINVRPTDNGGPAWTLDTTFIIAEELHGEDSTMYIPCEIIPAGMGDKNAQAFTVQVFKTISPVKTYTRPEIKIHSKRTTEFTWGNSMQPAIQDFMKVMETLSHPPRDPSSRIGFWDKFRLILHWVVKVDFEGPVHLHLKGSYDPYLVNGHGAGFALAWNKNTQLRIACPNEQHETIQISAEELLVAIPDLDALNDRAALGTQQDHDPERSAQEQEVDMISRRYTKPCARFMNGVRVGFGFQFERACRPHECTKDCGSTDNNMHRLCRITEFKRHQEVILRSPEAVERDELKLGRAIDSYEGFRSDYIHFSVSLISPLKEIDPEHPPESVSHNSLHFSPKAFAHFFAWWHLFNHTMSLPIRQGKLFPDSPEPSKKFGRSLGTIKYRFDLQPVYVSHMYAQKSRQLWDRGRTESLGVKARFGRFRADCHQRAQEKVVRHEKLQRVKMITHKPFYAADLILEDIEVKGLRAEFHELPKTVTRRSSDTSSSSSSNASASDYEPSTHPKASQMPPADKAWFNFFDYVDADKRPFDHDPKVELVDFGDCPEVFFSMRKKVKPASPYDDDSVNSESGSVHGDLDERYDLERSKFGDEATHVCYLRENKSVAPVQIDITQKRIKEIEEKVRKMGSRPTPAQNSDIEEYHRRLRTLRSHIRDLEKKEKRHIDGDMFESEPNANSNGQDADPDTGEPFENVVHVHCPRLFLTNQSRNLAYQYGFSSKDRKREEYTTSYASLRSIDEEIKKRMKRYKESGPSEGPKPVESTDEAQELLTGLKQNLGRKNAESCFRLPVDHSIDHVDLRQPSLGLPSECAVKPEFRFLLLKPQITFRSEAAPDAIILLAVEEFSLKHFKVIDTKGKDDVAANVLSRNYGSMKGLQAFYPNAETLARDRDESGPSRGVRPPALPLEIFLDVRSEARDYDRIILKTDAALESDKFNHLRMPRGLEWPNVNDEMGQPITHLKSHTDKTTIIVPRITLSATSKHYSALYCVVTDLLMYQDPEHRHRSEQVNDFIFQFDRKDRDPDQLKADLGNLQRLIRHLQEVIRGYEQHLDLLNDKGKYDLFTIREHLFEASEQLFCIFEVIGVNFSRDDARAALKMASKLDVRAGNVAWHLLQDNSVPIVKLDIQGTMMSMLHNKDGSMDTACVVSDLSALNSIPDAIFPEVAIRYEPNGAPKRIRDPMASVVWSSIAPVGGIPIVRLLSVYLHPLRLQLEERVGRQVKDYIFNDRVSRRREAAESTPKNDSSTSQAGSKSTLELAPLHRSKSAVSVNSSAASSVGNRSVSTSGRPGDGVQDHFATVPKSDAAEMRRRASSTRTFIAVELEPTLFVLSYKRDYEVKHKGLFAVPQAVDIKFKTPRIAYNNKVWSMEEIFKQMQRDAIKSQLTPSFVGQVVRKTGLFRSKKTLRSINANTSPSARPGGILGTPSSRLKFAVESPSSEDDLDHPKSSHGHTLGSPIQRVVSRLSQSASPTSSGDRDRERSSSASHLSKSPSTSMLRDRERERSEPPDSMPSEENDSSDEDHEGGNIGRAVKGLIDKFKHRKDSPEVGSRRGSHDDISHFGSIGRTG